MFDLQRFAEGEGAEGQQQPTTPAETVEVSDDDKKAESTSEIDIEAKFNEMLAKAQQSWDAEWKKREATIKREVERQKKEAERLSRLSEEERQKAEIEAARHELEIKEKELQRKELLIEMTKVLDERKIPVKFMEYLIADDNESTLKRITDFEREYKNAIETAVNERLKGKTPPAGGKIQVGNGSPRVKDGFIKTILDNQAKRD